MAGTEQRRRRSRGEPRRLLLTAAIELFNERGYDAPTREIADRAGVSETLLFRNFGNKGALFKAAMVEPFVEFVDEFTATMGEEGISHDPVRDTEIFIGGLYDLFSTHRALVAALWSATTYGSSSLAETEILGDVWASFDQLVAVGRNATSGRPARNDIATRAIVSMVAGMAVGRLDCGERPAPTREEVIAEMVAISLYGRLANGRRRT